jgi:hypothetical protein
MKLIPLTKGLSAKVDDEDFEYLNQFHWHVDSKGYAVRNKPRPRQGNHAIYMHRVVNNTPDGLQTDHIDRDKLNNQKGNLRNATQSLNNYNNGSKGYGFHKASGKWRAYIDIKGKHMHLGLFLTKEEAMRVRETALKSVTLS